MRIYVMSVVVDDQAKALAFYTDVLGFVKKTDIDLGAGRWLTLTSPGEPEGTELLLEPEGHPAAAPFKKAIVADGIPWTSFMSDDVHAEHRKLKAKGVMFTQPPVEMGGYLSAVFDDTCGNLIQIVQKPSL